MGFRALWFSPEGQEREDMQRARRRRDGAAGSRLVASAAVVVASVALLASASPVNVVEQQQQLTGLEHRATSAGGDFHDALATLRRDARWSASPFDAGSSSSRSQARTRRDEARHSASLHRRQSSSSSNPLEDLVGRVSRDCEPSCVLWIRDYQYCLDGFEGASLTECVCSDQFFDDLDTCTTCINDSSEASDEDGDQALRDYARWTRACASGGLASLTGGSSSVLAS